MSDEFSNKVEVMKARKRFYSDPKRRYAPPAMEEMNTINSAIIDSGLTATPMLLPVALGLLLPLPPAGGLLPGVGFADGTKTPTD